MPNCHVLDRNRIFWDDVEYVVTSNIVQYAASSMHVVYLDENGDLWCINPTNGTKLLSGLGNLRSFSYWQNIIIGITVDGKVVSAYYDYNSTTLSYTTRHSNIESPVKLSGHYALDFNGIVYKLDIYNIYVREYCMLPTNGKITNIELMGSILVLLDNNNTYRWMDLPNTQEEVIDLDILSMFPGFVLTKNGEVYENTYGPKFKKVCTVPILNQVVFISTSYDKLGDLLLVMYDSGSTLVYRGPHNCESYTNFNAAIERNVMPLEMQILKSS